MFHENLLLIITLLFAVSMLVMLGQKLKISYPIFLVLGGLLISLIPGIPNIQMDPDMILTLFLPPLLYEAAWYTSWRQFWKWKRPIVLLAFGLVFFTSTIIAYLTSSMIPGFTLALGFLLGGIISPPDAVAATSVLKGLKIPKRLTTILEGESLINDAASLIVFRVALVAVISGHFSLGETVVDFFVVGSMGVVVGLVIAHILYVIHRFFPTTSDIDTALTLMSPYVMYIIAEHYHYSGVMAVVSGGLFLSYRSHELLSYSSRIQTANVWATIIFILNGIVFILIGLELPVIINGLDGSSLQQGIQYGLIISLITIAIRFIWVYPIAHIPRFLSKKIRETEPSPGWKGPLVTSWAGMRGVVSLAAALSIPLTLDGAAFPQRNLILLITFIVILITLVVQGLSLPLIIRLIKIEEIDDLIPEEEQMANIKLRLMKASVLHLEKNFQQEIKENELVANLKKRIESSAALTSERLESLECQTIDFNEVHEYKRVFLDIIHAQRNELLKMRNEKVFELEIIQKQQMELDFDESKFSQNSH
ncbi:MAG: Na+/H+ antiporter [Flavobacterium sp.]|nr:MAG: Na+/H+ antiporter [Flavobacterium sp.]